MRSRVSLKKHICSYAQFVPCGKTPGCNRTFSRDGSSWPNSKSFYSGTYPKMDILPRFWHCLKLLKIVIWILIYKIYNIGHWWHRYERLMNLKLQGTSFYNLSSKGLLPNVRTYCIMIIGLCQEGLSGEAGELFEEMDIMRHPEQFNFLKKWLQGDFYWCIHCNLVSVNGFWRWIGSTCKTNFVWVYATGLWFSSTQKYGVLGSTLLCICLWIVILEPKEFDFMTMSCCCN